MPRRWIKLWCTECLDGTLAYDLKPAERAVWFGLLALAGVSRQDGIIGPGDGRGYPLSWVANRLQVDQHLLRRSLDRLQASDRVSIDEAGIITITNWRRYQSEYARQREYR